MKRIIPLACCLLAAVSTLRAVDLDDQYVGLVNLIQQADELTNDPSGATILYLKVQKSLGEIQRDHPQWNKDIIKFRMDYVSERLVKLGQPQPAADAAQTTPQGLNAQKLDESPSAQPAAAAAPAPTATSNRVERVSQSTSIPPNGLCIARKIRFNGKTSAGYELDGYGLLHPIGGAPAPKIGTSWPGMDIARDFVVFDWNTPKGYVMDGHGGIFPFGGAPRVKGAASWPKLDIARAIRMDPRTLKGYQLDGFGGVHPLNGAPAVTGAISWKTDIARSLAITDWKTGTGYVLDGYGGIHPINHAPAVQCEANWPGWDIARALVIRPKTLEGYLLDGYGGIHLVNNARKVIGAAFWAGKDVARDIAITDWDVPKGYTLDAVGRWHPFGGAPEIKDAPCFVR